ncbi:WD40-repeat-containing domain protein [Pavlovales sp. CCMP2436]|nr:WD40-repeat-containing domain protein [Pavlovales sp. CCMP2436]
MVEDDWLVAGIGQTGQPNIIRIWNMESNATQDPATMQFGLVGVLQGHTAAVQNVQVAGTTLYSCARDNTIKVWDLSTGQGVTSVTTVHTEFMMGLRLYDVYLFSAGLDGKVVPNFERRGILLGHTQPCRALCPGPGNSIFSAGMDQSIKVWEFE